MNTRIAAPQKMRIVPAFMVQKLEGKYTRTLIQFDKEGKKHDKQVEVDAGYLVSFPMKGHSIRVKDAKELERLGFDQTIPLVDDGDNDDVHGFIPNTINAAGRSN